MGRVRWTKSLRAVRASLTLRRENLSELKDVIVVAPAKCGLLKQIEQLKEKTEEEKLGEFAHQWHFWEPLVYSGLEFGSQESEAGVTTKTFYPKVSSLGSMAEESLRLVAAALERLTVNQSAQGWSRHLKAPDVFKPEN